MPGCVSMLGEEESDQSSDAVRQVGQGAQVSDEVLWVFGSLESAVGGARRMRRAADGSECLILSHEVL